MEDEIVPVNPDNWTAFQMFTRVIKQWRCNAAGPIGLDYNVFPFIFSMMGITDLEEQQELFECMRYMEAEALEVFKDMGE